MSKLALHQWCPWSRCSLRYFIYDGDPIHPWRSSFLSSIRPVRRRPHTYSFLVRCGAPSIWDGVFLYMFQKKIKFLSLIWHCASSKSVGPYRGVRDKNCVNVSRMQWIYSFLLLLAFLFFFLVGIQKLRLGFKIFTNEAQLEIFNTAVALCLVVSGNISNKQTFSCLIFVPGQSVTFRFRNFSVSKLFHFFWWYRYRFRKFLVSKKVSVSVSKKFGIEKVSVSVPKYFVLKKDTNVHDLFHHLEPWTIWAKKSVFNWIVYFYS